jgi:hypothetical protein
MQVGYPQVAKTETEKFSKEWTYNGIAVSLDNTSIQFATDWANLLLRNIFTQMAQQAQAQMKAQESKSLVEA